MATKKLKTRPGLLLQQMLTVQKHGGASSRDWKSQLYLHSSLQKQAWKWPACSSVNTEDLESISTEDPIHEEGRTHSGGGKAISFPSTNLPRCLFTRHSGPLSERVKLENKETSSYLIDKLSQINSTWVDGGSGAAPQETGNKKTAAWDGAAAPHGKTPPHGSALLSQHASLPIWTEAA